MPTTVTKSIGTSGRDYSTLQSWEDACPADLVSADQIWKGECYNDSEFTAGVTISGQTTDSTRYVWLTAAAGHSFKDHANVRTNALAYSTANGVGITASGATDDIVSASSSYTLIERLQVKRTGTGGAYTANRCIAVDYFGNGSHIRDCIAQRSSTYPRIVIFVGGNRVTNCAVLSSNGGTGIETDDGGIVMNCSVVNTGSVSGTGVRVSYYYGTVSNCVMTGWTTGTNAASARQEYNATSDTTAAGTGAVTSIVAADCFVDPATDLRLKAGSVLIDAGNTDATYAPNDISGTARDAGLDGDIGAWEYTSGGGGGGGVIEPFLRARRPGVTWTNDRSA